MGAQPLNNTPWPADHVEKLKELWALGKTASEIARMIPGRSREAVCGKARRLKLAARDTPAHLAATKPKKDWAARAPEVKRNLYAATNGINARGGRPPKPGPQSKPGAVFGAMGATTAEEASRARVKAAAYGEKALAAFTVPANDDSVLLIERRRSQCAWPVGTPDRPALQMCCGQRVPDGQSTATESYCPDHAV